MGIGLMGAATGLAAAEAEAETAVKPSAEGWIDAHSHIWGRDIERFPLAPGQTLEDLAPPSFTGEELLAQAQPLGVQRGVLIQHSIYHLFDNSYLIEAARQQPERFRVVGMLDDRQPEVAAAMPRLREQHVTGFRITPKLFGRDQWLKSVGMQAMWEEGAKVGQAMCCLTCRKWVRCVAGTPRPQW